MLEIPIILKDYWNFLQNESIETLVNFIEVYNNYLEQENKVKIEEEKEKRSWQLYVSIYPNFDKKNFMTYAKFIDKNGIEPPNKNNKKVEINDSDKMTKNDILLLAEIKRKKWEEEKI